MKVIKQLLLPVGIIFTLFIMIAPRGIGCGQSFFVKEFTVVDADTNQPVWGIKTNQLSNVNKNKVSLYLTGGYGTGGTILLPSHLARVPEYSITFSKNGYTDYTLKLEKQHFRWMYFKPTLSKQTIKMKKSSGL